MASGPSWLRADGGTLRVANATVGEYRVSVYTAPTPVSPDSIDVSVLATFGRGREVPPDLTIEVVAAKADGSGAPIRQPATRDQAEDPRYYAAKFALGSVGEWDVTVEIRGPLGEGEVDFTLTAREPGPLSNPWVILVAAFLPLLLVGWWLLSPPSSRPGAE